jgi:hypothetical protein
MWYGAQRNGVLSAIYGRGINARGGQRLAKAASPMPGWLGWQSGINAPGVWRRLAPSARQWRNLSAGCKQLWPSSSRTGMRIVNVAGVAKKRYWRLIGCGGWLRRLSWRP